MTTMKTPHFVFSRQELPFLGVRRQRHANANPITELSHMTVRKIDTTRFKSALNLESLEDRSVPTTFTVTNTADSGTGSLRQAITDANINVNSGGPDRIEFNISGVGVKTIQPQ